MLTFCRATMPSAETLQKECEPDSSINAMHQSAALLPILLALWPLQCHGLYTSHMSHCF